MISGSTQNGFPPAISRAETNQPNTPSHLDPANQPQSTEPLNLRGKSPGDFPVEDYGLDKLQTIAQAQMGSEAMIYLHGRPPKEDSYENGMPAILMRDAFEGQSQDVQSFAKAVSDAFFNKLDLGSGKAGVDPKNLNAAFTNEQFQSAYQAAHQAAIDWDHNNNNGGIRSDEDNTHLADRMIKAGLSAWTSGEVAAPSGEPSFAPYASADESQGYDEAVRYAGA